MDLLPICWDSCFKLFEEVQEFDSKVKTTARQLLPFCWKKNLSHCLKR